MRYLLHVERYSELSARKEYLFDIFRMYFFPANPEGSYIPLIPLISDDSILFITGHTDQVESYLEDNISCIPESTIVITSCFGKRFKKYATGKDIYVPRVDGDYCEIRKGEPYGFGFSISDAEINFYNHRGTIEDRIQAAYVRL